MEMSERSVPRRTAPLSLAPLLAGLAGTLGASGVVVWEALAPSLTNTHSDLVVWTSNLAALGPLVLTYITVWIGEWRFTRLGGAAIGAALGVTTIAYWVWELWRIAATS